MTTHPQLNQRRVGGEYSKENRILWPKDMFSVHSGYSSLSVLFRWCVPACKNTTTSLFAKGSMCLIRFVHPFLNILYQKHDMRNILLTILFMNLHEGFVWLLCSSKIVLVLKDKRCSLKGTWIACYAIKQFVYSFVSLVSIFSLL